jgi:hypothetical protein
MPEGVLLACCRCPLSHQEMREEADMERPTRHPEMEGERGGTFPTCRQRMMDLARSKTCHH